MTSDKSTHTATLSPPSSGSITISQLFGITNPSSLNFVGNTPDNFAVVYIAGTSLVILQLADMQRSIAPCLSTSSLGSLAVHPSRVSLAVGEKGFLPRVCVFSYPTLSLVNVMKNGAERSFDCMCFSQTGEKLATVSSSPDFLLSIWDWSNEKLLLQTKAFGQQIHHVEFSPNEANRLITAGRSHIRFWKMASTFTGLKLTGSLGKFGKVMCLQLNAGKEYHYLQVELTDISTCIQLPSGPVLSSSTYGSILIWEGNSIKAQVKRNHKTLCHDGPITYLGLEVNGARLVSAGRDGWIRTWDVVSLIPAEVSIDTAMNCCVSPLNQFRLGDLQCGISRVIRNVANEELVICAVSGSILQIPVESILWNHSQTKQTSPKNLEFKILMCSIQCSRYRFVLMTSMRRCHSGRVNSLANSPIENVTASAGQDGSVRSWNSKSKSHHFISKNSCPATCICWAPLTLDLQGRCILVGFASGTMHVYYCNARRWLRIHCYKPHRLPLTVISVAPNGALLATGSVDNTVFFLRPSKFSGSSPQQPYTPLGFVDLSHPISCLSWSPDSLSVMVVFGNGFVEITCPPDAEPVNGATFRLHVPCKDLHLQNISAATANTLSKCDCNVDLLDGQNFIDDSSTHHDICVIKALYHSESIALVVLRYSSTHFLGLAEIDMGKCAVRFHGKLVAAHGEVTTLALLRDSLVLGSQTGSIVVYSVNMSIENQITSQPHDCDSAVAAVAISCDASFLISGATDGVVAVQSMNNIQNRDAQQASSDDATPCRPRHQSSSYEGLCDATINEVEELPANAHCFEDARKEVADAKMVIASQKRKQCLLQEMTDIRHEFGALIAAHDALPCKHRLHPSELVVDVDLCGSLEDENEVALESIRLANSQSTEADKVLLRKLKDHFLNDLEKENSSAMDGQTMIALMSNTRVGSFRLLCVSDAIRARLNDLHAHLQSKSDTTSPCLVSTVDEVPGKTAAHLAKHVSHVDPVNWTACQTAPNPESACTPEARRLLRQQRRARLEELQLERPSQAEVDERDVEAILEVEARLGDCKLKSSTEYEVPVEQRVNVMNKCDQMILLQENIHSIKLRYNKSFSALREVKRLVKESLEAGNRQRIYLRAFGELLEPFSSLSPATSVSSAEPFRLTKQLQINLRDLPDDLRSTARSTLGKYEAGAYEDAVRSQTEQAESAGSIRGLVQTSAGELASERQMEKLVKLLREVRTRTNVLGTDADELILNMSTVAQCQEFTVQRLKSHAAAFDIALSDLRNEFLPLKADLHSAELRLLVCLQELLLLKTFEARDNALSSKIDKATQEICEVQDCIRDFSSRLAAKRCELNSWNETRNLLIAALHRLIPDEHQCNQMLTKLFFKKVKRSKMQSSDADFHACDDDDDDVEEVDVGDGLEEEDDSCPSGCEMALYEQVLELRERRLDQEDALIECQGAMEELQRAHHRCVQRGLQIDRDMKSFTVELQLLQTEKQQHLNELLCTICVRPSQLHGCLQADLTRGVFSDACGSKNLEALFAVHSDGDSSVLFAAHRLQQLHARVFELDGITNAQRNNFRELHRAKVRLQRARQSLETRISTLQTKCEDIQMLKFGRLIDVHALDHELSTTSAQLLRDVKPHTAGGIPMQENHTTRRQHALRSSLMRTTRENTCLLTKLAVLSSEELQLEKLAQKSNETNDVSSRASTRSLVTSCYALDRDRLLTLIKVHAEEIDALKTEINILRRKGPPPAAIE